MKCSVIIRSFNEESHIARLLMGLREQNMTPHEVILVDSGSTDKTVDIARYFGAHVINIDRRHFSFGRALNIGCEAASGDILVFVSAHVYPVYRTWLEKLIWPFEDDGVVLSYGKQRGNHVNKFSEHQIFKQWFPDYSATMQNTYFCNNANCAIRRSEWGQRRYDETLSGLEDLAWAKKAQAGGGRIAYVADAEVIHVHEESWARVRNRYRREALAMRRINENVSFSLLDFARLFAVNVISDYRAAAHQGVFGRELASVPLFRFNQLWGTYLGYRGPCEISAELKNRFYFPAPVTRQLPEPAEHAAQRINYETLTSEPKQS